MQFQRIQGIGWFEFFWMFSAIDKKMLHNRIDIHIFLLYSRYLDLIIE